jgi:tRNA pseudouridine55 synthase
MHAAIKVGGRRLYELAHRGQEIERPTRRIEITELELVAWEPPVATLLIDCSKGTYVRSIARDLGAEVGTGAYLSNLVRLRVGPFDLCEAMTLAELAEVDLPAAWPQIALHPDRVLEEWPALLLDVAAGQTWQSGGSIATSWTDDRLCRVYDATGTWLGVGAHDPTAGRWRPLKVVESAA